MSASNRPRCVPVARKRSTCRISALNHPATSNRRSGNAARSFLTQGRTSCGLYVASPSLRTHPGANTSAGPMSSPFHSAIIRVRTGGSCSITAAAAPLGGEYGRPEARHPSSPLHGSAYQQRRTCREQETSCSSNGVLSEVSEPPAPAGYPVATPGLRPRRADPRLLRRLRVQSDEESAAAYGRGGAGG